MVSTVAGIHTGLDIKAEFSHQNPDFLVSFFIKKEASSSPKHLRHQKGHFSSKTMGSIAASTSFQVLRDTKPNDTTLPAFMVSTTRGFLPRQEPIIELPFEFDILENILTRMPLKTLEGLPGLLATFTLGDTVNKELTDLTWAIDQYKDNLPLMNALYRDYSFLASAYLLEPCHQRFMKGEPYGLGRQTLPAVIALPISRCAEL